jgi:hypothetical protein
MAEPITDTFRPRKFVRHVTSTQGAATTCICGLTMDYSGLNYMTKRAQISAAHDAARAHLRAVQQAR